LHIATAAAAGSYDGTYSGKPALGSWWQNRSDCTPPDQLHINITDNHFDKVLLGAHLSVDIPATGEISASGVRTRDSRAMQLTGEADGTSLKLDFRSKYCSFHAELPRLQQATAESAPAVPAEPQVPPTAASDRSGIADTRWDGRWIGRFTCHPPARQESGVERSTLFDTGVRTGSRGKARH
jgi:hypothetical protein